MIYFSYVTTLMSVLFCYSLLALRIGGGGLPSANIRPILILNEVFTYTTHVHILMGRGASPPKN